MRRKRDKPVKIPKKHNRSSGESTPSDSPRSIKQEGSSSTDSSPLLKVTKQEISSSENSPLVNRITKQEVVTSDENSVTKEKGTKEEGILSVSHLVTKQKISPTPSGNGPIINVTGSLVDEVMEKIDSKATTSDYYSFTDLQCSDDTTPEDTTDASSSVVTKMKARGHARTHSAPLVLDEEGPTVSNKVAVTTVDIMGTSSNDQQQKKENKGQGVKESKVAPPIMVHYLGPLVLRKEVESLLIREGLSYLERQDFPLLSPAVFWNLVSVAFVLCAVAIVNLLSQVWYFTRLGLSSYLPRQALVPFSDFIENKVHYSG